MPTVLRIGPYRFFFYSNENEEPAHIHVQHNDAVAKFSFQPVSYASSSGFTARELNKILKMVEKNQDLFKEAWDEFFGN